METTSQLKIFYNSTDYEYYYERNQLIDRMGNRLKVGDIIQNKYMENVYMPDVIVVHKNEFKRQPITSFWSKRDVYLLSLDCREFIKIGNVNERGN